MLELGPGMMSEEMTTLILKKNGKYHNMILIVNLNITISQQLKIPYMRIIATTLIVETC